MQFESLLVLRFIVVLSGQLRVFVDNILASFLFVTVRKKGSVLADLQRNLEVCHFTPIRKNFTELENSVMIRIQLQSALFLVQANEALPSDAIILLDPCRSKIGFLCRLVLVQFVIRKPEENSAGVEGRR